MQIISIPKITKFLMCRGRNRYIFYHWMGNVW